MAKPSGSGFNKTALQWAFLIALGIVAIAYFVMPTRAGDRPAWSAELWALEEGEALVAAVYSTPPDEETITPSIAILCGDPLRLRNDPGSATGEGTDWTGQTARFEFRIGDRHFERELRYEAMDGNWATQLGAGDPLIAGLEAGAEVSVVMTGGGLPENLFSLEGSSAAIREVRAACR